MEIISIVAGAVVLAALATLGLRALDWASDLEAKNAQLSRSSSATLDAIRQIDRIADARQRDMFETLWQSWAERS